jgi:hypothetical protein
MKSSTRVGLLFFTVASVAAVCFGQKPEISDPRVLAKEFERTIRGNHQPGGSVVSMPNCTSKDPGGGVAILPKGQTRLLQIDKAHPDYFVTNTEVPNFLPKNYEPELLKTRVSRYVLDSNNNAIQALDGLLNLQGLQPAIEASGLRKGLEVLIGIQTPPGRPEPPRRTQLIESLTLREALNEMAAFYGTGIWTYQENLDCNGERITRIYFTTY